MTITISSVDLFTRVMAEMFDERDHIVAPTGFQSIFGRNNSQTIFSEHNDIVDIDLISGNEKTATLRLRGEIGRSITAEVDNLNEQKFNNVNRQFPLSTQYGAVSASQLHSRIAGEKPYQLLTKQQRLMILATKQIKEQTLRAIRLMERLAAQSARLGIQDAVLGTSKDAEKYDFGRNALNVVTPTVAWDQSTSIIIQDIDTGCNKLRQNGHVPGDAMVLGTTVAATVIKDSQTSTIADNRRFDLVHIGPNNPLPAHLSFMVKNGFDAIGMVTTFSGRTIYLFTYNEFYEDSSGDPQPYFPVNEALLFDSRVRCDRHFGPDDALPETTADRQFYIDRFGLDPRALPGMEQVKNPGVLDPRMFMHRAEGSRTAVQPITEIAPIFVTTHADAFVRYTGLITP